MLEIFVIYVCLSLVLIPIFRVRGAVHGYGEAKEYMFLIISALAFCLFLVFGLPRIFLTPDYFFIAFVIYVTLSVYWTDAPELAVSHVPRWWAMLLLYLSVRYVPRETLILAVFLPSIPIAIYGMMQQIWKYDPLDKWVQDVLTNHTKALRFYSFLGNSNYSGIYLVGSVFAGVYCVSNISLWFTPLLALVIVAVAMTRCRGAWVGIMVGFLGVTPAEWPLILPLWFAFAIISYKRLETARTRIHFLHVGWMMFKERWLFGWGPASFRRKLFKTQAFLNQNDPKLMGTLKKKGRYDAPLGKRMHNDHAEMFVEYGIIGAGLWFVFVVLTVRNAILAQQWYIAGGLLGISVSALFFYPFRSLSLGIAFWAFAGAAGSTPVAGISIYVIPWQIALPLAALALFITWQFAVKKLMAIAHHTKYHLAMRDKDQKIAGIHINQALNLDPLNGNVLADAAAFYIASAPPMAMSTAYKMIDHYDGEKIEWSVWTQFGMIAASNGAAALAQVAFKMAIYLNPSYKKPYEALDQLNQLVESISKNMGKQKRGNGDRYKKQGRLYVKKKTIIRP